MTTLDFANSLVENPFSFSNGYVYGDKRPYGLYFSKESQIYPFILKGEQSCSFELEYSFYTYQLRNRLLSTKRIKEIMNSARLPLYFVIKRTCYLIGKGFLSTFDLAGNHKLLFIACVDGTKNITSIQQVRFYVSKDIYDDQYKPVQPAIKDLVTAHSGDVIMCNNILDYIGERLTFPRGGSLSELNKYKQAVIRTCLMQDFIEGNPANEPLVVESNRGTVSIETGSPDILDQLEGLRDLPVTDIISDLRRIWSTSDPVAPAPLDVTDAITASVSSLMSMSTDHPLDAPNPTLPS